MAAKKYIVEFDADERERLNALISKGKAPAKTILKARILLKADCAEGGPGLARRSDRGGARHQSDQGHAGARETGDRGARCGAEPQEAREVVCAGHAGEHVVNAT